MLLLTVLTARAAGQSNLFDRACAMFERMADIIVADKTDCPKMAADLQAVATVNAELLQEMKTASNAKPKPKPTPAQRARIEAANKRERTGLQACSKHPGVQAAMERFR